MFSYSFPGLGGCERENPHTCIYIGIVLCYNSMKMQYEQYVPVQCQTEEHAGYDEH